MTHPTSPISTAPTSDWNWGIDTVKISFHVNPDHCDLASPLWGQSSTRNLRNDMPEAETFIGRLALTNADARVSLFTARNVAHVEFNAARAVSPKSAALLPPAALAPLVRGVLEQLHQDAWPVFISVTDDGEIVWDADWASHVRLARLDLARNFDIDDPLSVKAGLRSVRGSYAKDQVLHTDAHGGWMLSNRTKRSGSERFYDKAAELASYGLDERFIAPSGTMFRFEAQLQKDRLAALGLTTLDRVTEQAVWRALEARWDATGWGCWLPGQGDVLKALKGLPLPQRQRLIGFLHQMAVGDTSEMSTGHLREMTARAKSVGLVPGMPVALLGPPTQRLDLVAGTLVDRPAGESVA